MVISVRSIPREEMQMGRMAKADPCDMYWTYDSHNELSGLLWRELIDSQHDINRYISSMLIVMEQT